MKCLKKLGLYSLIGSKFEDEIKFIKYKKGSYIYLMEEDLDILYYVVRGKVRIIVTLGEIEYSYLLRDDEFEGINFALCDFTKVSQERPVEVEYLILEETTIAHIPLKKLLTLNFKLQNEVLKELLVKMANINTDKFKKYVYHFHKTDEEIFINFLKEIGEKEFSSKDASFKLNIKIRVIQKLIKKWKERNILYSDRKLHYKVDTKKLKSYIKKQKSHLK